MNKIKSAFDAVRADEALKDRTLAYISEQKRNKNTSKRTSPIRLVRYAAACACAVMVFAGFRAYSLLTSPASYISIDVNPSIELVLNTFDRVITAEAYNDDGAEIINSIDIKGKKYTDAVDILLTSAELSPYLTDDAELSFTVVSDDEEQLINGIQSCPGYSLYNGECHSANIQLRNEAVSHNMSCGKYSAYLVLSKYDSSITPEECSTMTMRELRDLIEQYSGEPYPSGNGAHHSENGSSANGSSENGGSTNSGNGSSGNGGSANGSHHGKNNHK